MREMNMTEKQWGDLLVALGQVPALDVAMNLCPRETLVLHELALRGEEWRQRGFLRCGTGDQADALDFAQRLGIDTETAEPKPAPTDDEQAAQLAQDRLDQFMDNLAHAGE
jgi:hypothetical protein